MYFLSSTARVYTLLWQTNLAGDAWTPVPGQTNVWGDGLLRALRDTHPASPWFYRVRVQVPDGDE